MSEAILMYPSYTAIPGSGVLLRSTHCIPAVVRAVLPCTHAKILIYPGILPDTQRVCPHTLFWARITDLLISN